MINKKGCDQRKAEKARKENIMTNREFFMGIASMTNIDPELVAHAEMELEKLNKRNAARAAKPSKSQKENEPVKAEILNFFEENEGFHVASEISTTLGISVQKASALCRQMVEEEKLTVKEVKIPKKGKQKAYCLATFETAEEENKEE